MTTISPFAAGSYLTTRSTSQLLAMKSQLDALTTQLSTGRTAETYGGLGAGRSSSLTARATLSALDGYDAGIDAAQTRVQLASTSLQQITTLTSDLRRGIATNPQGVGTTVTAQLGRADLDGAIDALSQSSAGQYLFGGRTTDTAPVKSTDIILNGDSTTTPKQDGLATLVAQQKAADLGAGGLGRLQLGATSADNTFQLSEDQADTTGETRANFGFRLVSATATGAITAAATSTATPATVTGLDHAPVAGESFRVTVNLADGSQKSFDLTASASVPAGSTTAFGLFGSPAAAAAGLNAFAATQGGTVASVQSGNTPALNATFGGGAYAAYDIGLSGQPKVGDSITIELALHDGTKTSVTLTAAASGTTATTGTFAIGADAATTAANMKAALTTALGAAAAGPLSASSTTRAAEDFFSASTASGQTPKRIDTSGATPTYKDAASTDTVIWYQGDAASTDPRATASVRAGANLDVPVGARANEVPIQKALAGFAALAVDGMADPSGSTVTGRYAALTSRTSTLLGKASDDPSLESIAVDFGLAASTLTSAKSQNAATRLTLQNTVDGVESAPIEEVASKLLEMQNRLQASYQITSSLSKLSLVNYMS